MKAINIQITFKIDNKNYGGVIPISDNKQDEAYIRRQGYGIVDAAIKTLQKENVISK